MILASLSIVDEARMLRHLGVGRGGHTLFVGWRRQLARGLREVAWFYGPGILPTLREIEGGPSAAEAVH